ncbi:hypothetical protein [Rufibacter sp. XAAS-G3-1]|uniref:hypothetical protein n=1 Tax=Rufibacter sp. XAAS-G3-1 TaxID=2729134 RepID=UPI0015E7ABB4|nr:hypothetical protein [Rufibacter sp. XAAS-G3-1]
MEHAGIIPQENNATPTSHIWLHFWLVFSKTRQKRSHKGSPAKIMINETKHSLASGECGLPAVSGRFLLYCEAFAKWRDAGGERVTSLLFKDYPIKEGENSNGLPSF